MSSFSSQVGIAETVFTVNPQPAVQGAVTAERAIMKSVNGIDRHAGKLRGSLIGAAFALDGFVRTGGGLRGVLASTSALGFALGNLPGLIAALVGGGLLAWYGAVKSKAEEAAAATAELVKRIHDADRASRGATVASIGARGAAAGSTVGQGISAFDALVAARVAAAEAVPDMQARRRAIADEIYDLRAVMNANERARGFKQRDEKREAQVHQLQQEDAALVESLARIEQERLDATTELGRISRQILTDARQTREEYDRQKTSLEKTKAFAETLSDLLGGGETGLAALGAMGLSASGAIETLRMLREQIPLLERQQEQRDQASKAGAAPTPRGGTSGLVDSFLSLQRAAISQTKPKPTDEEKQHLKEAKIQTAILKNLVLSQGRFG